MEFENKLISSIIGTGITYENQIVHGGLIRVSSLLDIPRDIAWKELQKSSLLRYVSHGKTKFSQLPKEWKVGEDIKTNVQTKILGLIPITSTHLIRFTEINHDSYRATTEESNSTIKIWNHSMQMKAEGDKTRYIDEITIYAGLLTGIIAKQTEELYRHRHRNWERVVNILQKEESTDNPIYDIPTL